MARLSETYTTPTTPYDPLSGQVPDYVAPAMPMATPYAPGTAYNPLYGNPLNINTPATTAFVGGGGTYTPLPTASANTVIGGVTQDTGNTSMVSVLVNKLLAAGIPASTAEKARGFFTTLLSDGVPIDNAVDYFYYQPSYTSKAGVTYESPYQTDFGKFNKGLATPKNPNELVNWVLGVRDIGTKYNLAPGFTDDDAIAKLIKNNVTVKDFDARANEAQLKAITADPYYVNSLKALNYISSAQDLTSFFLNPDIAQTEFDKRAKTAAFGTEALRMQTPEMTFDKSFIEKQGAALAAQGYSEGEITQLAQKGYSNIAQNIQPGITLAGVYQKSIGAANVQDLLQQQEFNKVASKQLQTAASMEAGAFSGSAGTSGTSTYLRKTSLQQPGAATPFQY